jgi:hypothetical protein
MGIDRTTVGKLGVARAELGVCPDAGRPAGFVPSSMALQSASSQQPRTRRSQMPRYVIERTFPNGLEIPTTPDGRKALLGVIENNATEDVVWVHSYVTEDHTRSFCVYDAPSPESIRRAAGHNDLPVNTIHEVSVLDPYFYVSAGGS